MDGLSRPVPVHGSLLPSLSPPPVPPSVGAAVDGVGAGDGAQPQQQASPAPDHPAPSNVDYDSNTGEARLDPADNIYPKDSYNRDTLPHPLLPSVVLTPQQRGLGGDTPLPLPQRQLVMPPVPQNSHTDVPSCTCISPQRSCAHRPRGCPRTCRPIHTVVDSLLAVLH